MVGVSVSTIFPLARLRRQGPESGSSAAQQPAEQRPITYTRLDERQERGCPRGGGKRLDKRL